LRCRRAKGIGNGVDGNIVAIVRKLGDTNASYLYEIADTLGDMIALEVNSEPFQELAEAPADADFKGLAPAPTNTPVPEPSSLAVLAGVLIAFAVLRRRV
jgi:hypothetical protein